MEEETHMPISGCFVAEKVVKNNDDDDDDEEEEDDDIPWLAYNEVNNAGGKSFVQYSKPKQAIGSLVDLQTGKCQSVKGSFPLPDQWWQVSILRTRTSKDKKKFPKDQYALSYKLRDDPKIYDHCLVNLFISKLQRVIEYQPRNANKNKNKKEHHFSPVAFRAGSDLFERYLKERNQYKDLDFDNLALRIQEFYDSFTDETRDANVRLFKRAIFDMDEYRCVERAQSHPELFRYLPQLFPGHFRRMIQIHPDKLRKLALLLDNDPGLLAFKQIVKRKCNILGCETNSNALRLSGLMSKVPQNQQEAMAIYEFLKDQTKRHGHTYIFFDRILDDLGQELKNVEEAYEFLEKNCVTKTKVEGGQRKVFPMELWQAEHAIASGLHSLVEQHDGQPWLLDIDWDGEDFRTIREDADQWRAAQLIANNAVVAISGKGGCGKTHVVTKVLTAAHASRKQATGNDNGNKPDPVQLAMDAETQAFDGEEDLFNFGHDEDNDKDSCPDIIQLLLTAPTGKAANLLGKRADSPSFTLHQVIFSYRNAIELGIEWKHKDTNVLVVDECSLVAVSTFAFLIELLIENANLKRVVLLGDIRQLPSIEPGNFLEDTFKSLELLRCGVELRTNHRAESQIVIDNAIRISNRTYPQFHKEKFTFCRVLDANPAVPANDYTVQDTIEEVNRLLAHDALQSDITSQFISFTNNICEIINDICCNIYSKHRIRDEKKRQVFEVNDKICCTRNASIEVYEDKHGVMEVKMKTVKVKEKEEQWERDMVTGEPDGNQESDKEKQEPDTKRLCNGEIFWIEKETEQVNNMNEHNSYLWLSDRAESQPEVFCVHKKQLNRICKIRHAWARTIHTFQGSETDSIIYIVGPQNKHQNWQHVYTAITRGKKLVFIVGQESVLRAVVKRPERKRQTSLRKQLIELLQKSKNLVIPTQNVTMATQKRPPTQSGNFMTSPSKPAFMKDTPAQPLNHTTDLDSTAAVLTSLAGGHGNDLDIEEYYSDEDSPSLFTSIKPRPVKTSEDIEMETGYSDSDADSDDSQSLLTSSGTRTNASVLHKGRTVDSCHHTKAVNVDIPRQLPSVDSDSTDPDSDDSQSLLSSPTSVNVTSRSEHPQTIARTSLRSSRDFQEPGPSSQYITGDSIANTGANLRHCSDQIYPNTCITNGHVQRKQISINTSSPYRDLSTFNIPSGPSLTTVNDRSHRNSFPTGRSIPIVSVPPWPAVHPGTPSGQSGTSSTETTPNDVAPGSNESQWSEGIDDSDYLNIQDGNLSYQSPADLVNGVTTTGKNVARSTLDSSINQATMDGRFATLRRSLSNKFGKTSPYVNESVLNRSTSRTTRIADISADSQWSEVEDNEQYLTLEIDDIIEMEHEGPTANTWNISNNNTHSFEVHRSPVSIPDVENEISKTPEHIVPDTPPTPKFPNTPPNSDEKRGTVPDPRSPACKRQLTIESPWSRKRSRNDDKQLSVSPLKQSLSKLDFN